jgi:hypothetical protein
MNKKFRWSKVYESSEEELTTLLQSRNIIVCIAAINFIVGIDEHTYHGIIASCFV